MKKRYENIVIIHHFADGRVMTNEEFMSKPMIIRYEGNEEIFEEANRLFDPDYPQREKAKLRRELAERRKAELENEMQKIRDDLAKI